MFTLEQGFLAVAPAIKRIGVRSAMVLGIGSQVIQNLLFSLSSKTWHFYAIVAATSPTRAFPMVALKAVTVRAAMRAGMHQGELQGAISNLQTLCRILGPLLWSNLFAWATKRGRSQLFYLPVALLSAVQLGFSLAVDTQHGAPKFN